MLVLVVLVLVPRLVSVQSEDAMTEKERADLLAERIKRGATVNTLPSLTRQADKDACDVNQIMKRYEKTGEMPAFATRGFFADVSEIGDFRGVQEKMLMAGEIFAQLPPKKRAEFNNDVAEFLDYASNPANFDSLVELGVVEGPAPAPAAAPDVPAEAPATP